MNEWDFDRAEDLMNKLNKLAHSKNAGQELEEAVFKFRVDWMFLERRIKALIKTMPDPKYDPKSYREPLPKQMQ